jgi:hypothetical protein
VVRTLNFPWRWIALPVLLLAVMLQANAVVRSLVMQATPVADMAFCSAAMAGMGADAARAGHDTHAKAPRATCPFCEVATHVPLFMAAAPVPRCETVAFIVFDAFADRPIREPPAIVARARDPPPTA